MAARRHEKRAILGAGGFVGKMVLRADVGS